jgi:hypothetical protein
MKEIEVKETRIRGLGGLKEMENGQQKCYTVPMGMGLSQNNVKKRNK